MTGVLDEMMKRIQNGGYALKKVATPTTPAVDENEAVSEISAILRRRREKYFTMNEVESDSESPREAEPEPADAEANVCSDDEPQLRRPSYRFSGNE